MLNQSALTQETLVLYRVRSSGMELASRLLTEDGEGFRRLQVFLERSRKQGSTLGSRFAGQFDEQRVDVAHNDEGAFKQCVNKTRHFLSGITSEPLAEVNLQCELIKLTHRATGNFDIDADENALIREEVMRDDDWQFARKVGRELKNLRCDAISFSRDSQRYSSLDKQQANCSTIEGRVSATVGIQKHSSWVLCQGKNLDIPASNGDAASLAKPVLDELRSAIEE
jgi:hypothetical protein